MNFLIRKIKKSKEFLSFMIIKISAQGIDFIVPLIIAKVLTPELFGSFSLFKMMIFLGVAVFIEPIISPFTIESNKEHAERNKSNRTFTSVIMYIGISTLLFSMLFIFFGKYVIEFTGLSYDEYGLIFILAVLSLSIKTFISNLFIAQDNKKAHLFTELGFSLIFLTYLIVILLNGSFNLYNIFAGYFISILIILFTLSWFIDYKRLFPLQISKENIKTVFHFGLWSIIGYTASYLINWGDNIVLKYYVSLAEIGIYNLAYQFFKGLIMVSFMIYTFYLPFVSRNINNKEKIFEYIHKKRTDIMILVIVGIVLIEIFIGFFFNLFFGPSYASSIGIIRILLIANLLAFYLSFTFPIFNATKKYKITQLFLIIQVALNLLLNILLIPILGIYGAAIATVLAYIIYGIITEFKFRRILKDFYNSKSI